MSKSRQKKTTTKGRNRNARTASKKKRLRLGWIVAGLVVVVVAILLAWKGTIFRTDSADPVTPVSTTKKDFSALKGEWVRPDGGYVIRVGSIKPGGKADVGYFNPRPIHVAEAVASVEDGKAKLFIKLQDKGYPGSTYTLFLHEEKAMLMGIYYQAALSRSFEVVFIRKR
jgi:hypothetical protein